MSETQELTGQQGADQQRHARSWVLYMARLTVGAEEVDCEVLNVSMGGAKLRLSKPVDCGARVALTIDPHAPLPAKVAWQSGQDLGIEFLCGEAQARQLLKELLQNPDPRLEKRGYARVAVLWSAELLARAQRVDCRVLNISPFGIRLRLLEPAQVQGPLQGLVGLRIERFGEFTCDVIWRDGDSLGITFRNDPEDIIRIFGAAVPALRMD